MYRLTTISLDALGQEYETRWVVAFWRESAAISVGTGLVDDGRRGVGCVIGFRVTHIQHG